ncbi:hypothetical protein MASSI9I_50197 [Massilia sp. 9I]|nr:hypothetical protein MASSI9I_50197 [Massilia sp. 9I]
MGKIVNRKDCRKKAVIFHINTAGKQQI